MDEARLLLACLSAAGPRRRALGTRLAQGPLAEVAALPEFAPQPRDWAWADRQRAVMRRLGLRILVGAQIPQGLRAARPAALFIRGPEENLHRPAVGIVGSRQASPSARAWARDIATEAARAGWVVASGGARGVDRAAHEGALLADGPTVVYLGVAADRVYPGRHRAFLGEILRRGGTLVSEHPPGVATAAYDHAQRNRLIAAHAQAVWIAEAAAASGSLGTAQWARKLGKGIWISPPGIGNFRDGLRILEEGDQGHVWPLGRTIPPPWAPEGLRDAASHRTFPLFSAGAVRHGEV